MTDKTTMITEYLKKIGKRGGTTTKQRHPDQFRKIGALGAKRRWQAHRRQQRSRPEPERT